MHDPKAAIKQLAEMQVGTLPKKTELTGKDGGPLNQVTYTAEDYAKAQQKLEEG
jgi:phage terminase small subunit